MNVVRPNKDIVEIFGYAPNDTTSVCRKLWTIGACPFVEDKCTKTNHDKSVVYGTCSVTTPYGDCIICPNRFYGGNLEIFRTISSEVFGNVAFKTFNEYVRERNEIDEAVIALGMYSGKEIQPNRSMSMDWILAHIKGLSLIDYIGIEVQSIDITGNYRDCWYAYKNISEGLIIPKSEHGLNWANVHKRLIPQIIRKSILYSKSNLVKRGLYFIVPEIVYGKFEEILGKDIISSNDISRKTITIKTYKLADFDDYGIHRKIVPVREIIIDVDDFSRRFISGINLPTPDELDNAVRNALGVQ